jgi:predicted ATPase
MRGEREYEVAPLTVLDARHLPLDVFAGAPAIVLFSERAASRCDFTVTEENVGAIAEMRRQLDGLPLANGLAAARSRALPPHMLAERLKRRLSLLAGGARDLPARQQTLRDTLDWSHDLLNEGERRLFRRLAVFVGGWTPEAAISITRPFVLRL